MGSQPEQSERALSEPVMQHRHDHRQSQAAICAITSSSARCALRNQSVGRLRLRLRSQNVNCRSDDSDRRAATRVANIAHCAQIRMISRRYITSPLRSMPPTERPLPFAYRLAATTHDTCRTRIKQIPDRPLTSRARLWIYRRQVAQSRAVPNSPWMEENPRSGVIVGSQGV
jgi:hypothetical protein